MNIEDVVKLAVDEEVSRLGAKKRVKEIESEMKVLKAELSELDKLSSGFSTSGWYGKLRELVSEEVEKIT